MRYKVLVPIAGYEIVEVEATSYFNAINKGYDLVAEMLDGKSLKPADKVTIKIEDGEYDAVLKLIAEEIDKDEAQQFEGL